MVDSEPIMIGGRSTIYYGSTRLLVVCGSSLAVFGSVLLRYYGIVLRPPGGIESTGLQRVCEREGGGGHERR
jgi:hypothetical protein